MKLIENMDGFIIALIAAATVMGFLTAIVPARDSFDTSRAVFDADSHTVTIVGEHP